MTDLLLLIIAAELGLALIVLGVLCYELLKPKKLPELPLFLQGMPGPQGEQKNEQKEEPKQDHGQYI